MEITGKLIYVGNIKSAPRADGRGEYRWREFVVEYEGGQYPKRILFEATADKTVELLEAGRVVNVRYDCTVRKYTGKDGHERLYNRFSVWRDGVVYADGGPQTVRRATEDAGDPALSMFSR